MEVGFGFYRFRENGDGLLTQFLEYGGRILDASPNYFRGKAHDVIGANRLVCQRPGSVMLWSKVGFPPSREALACRIRQKIVTEQELVGEHAINPTLIRTEILQAHMAHPELPVDALFLHNPELQLERLNARTFWELMKWCIEELEGACERGLIRRWGISVWEGLSGTSRRGPAFSIAEWETAARNIGGAQHHFELVQMPLSLCRAEVIAAFVERNTGPLADCLFFNKEIAASSPMNGGTLPKVLDANFTRIFGDTVTPGQACLLFLASLECVFTSLVSPRTPEQLLDIMEVRNQGVLERRTLCRLIELLVS